MQSYGLCKIPKVFFKYIVPLLHLTSVQLCPWKALGSTLQPGLGAGALSLIQCPGRQLSLLSILFCFWERDRLVTTMSQEVSQQQCRNMPVCLLLYTCQNLALQISFHFIHSDMHAIVSHCFNLHYIYIYIYKSYFDIFFMSL